jgi:hypothetical protein
MPPSATQQLAEIKLGSSLEEFVTSRRQRDVSWRKISLELRDATGVDVTHETLRSWFPGEQVAS